jgi:hypothetical protein
MKALVNILFLDISNRSKVAIAPTNTHRFRNAVRARGKSFEPTTAATPDEKKKIA